MSNQRISMKQQLDEVLEKWSPPQAPVLWILLNSCCCFAAALVFFLATLDKHMEEVKEFYLVYNVVICTVWLLEVGLYIRYTPQEDEQQKHCSWWWQHWLELAVAAYFVVDCAVEAFEWQLMEISAWNIYLDTGVDFVFFVYYLAFAIRTLIMRREQQLQQDGGVIVETGYVAAGDQENMTSTNEQQQRTPKGHNPPLQATIV